MADLKISQMPSGGSVQTTDEIPVNRGGDNYKVAVGSAAAADIGNDIGDIPVFVDVGGNPAYPAADGSLITDISAENVSFDNTGTTLDSDNVQDAIIEILQYSPSVDIEDLIGVPAKYRFKAVAEQQPTNLTFARATTAVRIDPRGYLTSVDSGDIRSTYNPFDGVFNGWLIEKSATNLFTYSNTFSNAVWSKTRITATASSGISPDGTNNAWSISDNEIGASAFYYPNMSVTSGTTYTISGHLKAGTRKTIQLRFLTNNGCFENQHIAFDIENGVMTGISGGGTVVSYGVTPLENGWFRIWASATAAATGNAQVGFLLNSPENVGDNFLIYGAQFETGTLATSYIETAASTVTRAADQVDTTIPSINEGALYFEGTSLDTAPSSVTFGRFLSISDETTNNAVYIEKTTGGLTRLQVVVGGVSYDSSTVNIPINTPFRASLSFKGGELYGAINGVPLTFSLMPTSINSMDTFRIGSYANGTNINNGMIHKDGAIFERALSQDQINRITAI